MPAIKKRHPKSKPTGQEHRVHLDQLLDNALADTFPASDPIAVDVESPPDDRVNEKHTK